MAGSRIRTVLIDAFLNLRKWTDVPVREAARRVAIARASGTKKTALLAEHAWWHGDAAAATDYWRELEVLQPLRADWPIAIAQAAKEGGAFEEVERVLLAARARGIDNERIELELLRSARMLRRSNSAVEDAEAIVADPAASGDKVFPAAFH